MCLGKIRIIAIVAEILLAFLSKYFHYFVMEIHLLSNIKLAASMTRKNDDDV